MRMLVRIGYVITLAMVLLSSQQAQANFFTPSNSTTASLSYAEIDTTVDSAIAKTLQQYVTELDFGFAGAPALLVQTYFVAVSDPAFQSAIAVAVATLKSDGAVSTSGPTLASSKTSASTGAQTVQTGRTSMDSLSTGAYVGPASFVIGDRGICQSATLVNTTPGLSGGTAAGNMYPLLSGCTGGTPENADFGGINYDTLDLTLATITTTTTTTTTNVLTQVYRIDGLREAAVAVPEPPAAAMLAIGLLALGTLGRILSPRNRRG